MSFAQDVKKEIISQEYAPSSLKAELYGYLLVKGELHLANHQFELSFSTNTSFIARRIVSLLHRLFQMDTSLLMKEQKKLDQKKAYICRITSDVEEMLIDLDIMGPDKMMKEGISAFYQTEMEALLRGMFLAKGSVNDPNRSHYHLELGTQNKEIGAYLVGYLSEYGIDAKQMSRSKGEIIYIKKAEQIGDFLKMIGATTTLFYFENERIKRDLNNVVNRVLNCDIANSDRSQASSILQLEAIKKIEEEMGYARLSPRMMEGVLLRTTYPDYTLQELSEVSEEAVGRFISKSGIHHIMQDLEHLAKSLSGGKK